jgi:predicted dehydrogenase
MLKGAIIGAGKIAETGHFPAYLSEEIKNEIKIIAVADQSDKRLNVAREYFTDVKVYKTFNELLSNETIDFVDICLPPHLHKPVIELCIDKGIHILCEKPLTNSLDSAVQIDKIIRSNKIVFIPCHQYKYAPVWKMFNEYANKITDSKIYLQFDVIRLQADNGYDESNPNWRTDPNYSGGGISVDTGVHYFYLILNMFGLPKSVFSNLMTLKHTDYSAEDSAFIYVQFENGLAQINLTWAGNKRYNSAMLVSSNTSLFYDGKVIELKDGIESRTIQTLDMSDKKVYVSLYVELFKELINRISTKDHTYDLLDESMNTMKLLEMAKISNEKKIRVNFN